ncbi:hypothetical protein LLG95_16150 [bacterium]|nr:hypothetical protein [bacterium]
MRWLIVIVVLGIIAAIYFSGDSSTQTTQQPAPPPAQVSEPEPTPEEPTPQPRQAQAPAPDKLQQIRQVANKYRIQIVNYQPGGNGAFIHIQWVGDSTGPGGDFIRDLLGQGIIRDATNPKQGISVDRQQRRVYWTQWQLAF